MKKTYKEITSWQKFQLMGKLFRDRHDSGQGGWWASCSCCGFTPQKNMSVKNNIVFSIVNKDDYSEFDLSGLLNALNSRMKFTIYETKLSLSKDGKSLKEDYLGTAAISQCIKLHIDDNLRAYDWATCEVTDVIPEPDDKSEKTEIFDDAKESLANELSAEHQWSARLLDLYEFAQLPENKNWEEILRKLFKWNGAKKLLDNDFLSPDGKVTKKGEKVLSSNDEIAKFLIAERQKKVDAGKVSKIRFNEASIVTKKRKHLSDIIFKQILKDANEYLRKAQYEIISDYYDANKDKMALVCLNCAALKSRRKLPKPYNSSFQ